MKNEIKNHSYNIVTGEKNIKAEIKQKFIGTINQIEIDFKLQNVLLQ